VLDASEKKGKARSLWKEAKPREMIASMLLVCFRQEDCLSEEFPLRGKAIGSRGNVLRENLTSFFLERLVSLLFQAIYYWNTLGRGPNTVIDKQSKVKEKERVERTPNS
jgi:hypothetical protein